MYVIVIKYKRKEYGYVGIDRGEYTRERKRENAIKFASFEEALETVAKVSTRFTDVDFEVTVLE